MILSPKRVGRESGELFARGALAVPSFRFLIIGQFTSTIGDYCYAVALPWYILSAPRGPLLLGTLLTCYGIPRVVFITLGGIAADKFGPQKVMIATDFARCVLTGVLAALATHRAPSVLAVAPVIVLSGAAQGAFTPSSYAIIPHIVPKRSLASANAVSMALTQAASTLGPLAGAALVTSFGPPTAFAVDSTSFAVSTITLAFISAREASRRDPRKPGREPLSGRDVTRIMRSSRGFQMVLLVVLFANFTIGGLEGVALPSLAHAKLGAGEYGLMLSLLSAGMVLGALASTRKAIKPSIKFGCHVILIQAAAIAITPFTGGLPGILVAQFIAGVCNGISGVIFRNALLSWAPSEAQGRVMGVVMLCASGTYPLSVAAAGFFVSRLGPVDFFPAAGGLVAFAMIIGLSQRQFREFGRLETQSIEAS
jgi:MFS family permease